RVEMHRRCRRAASGLPRSDDVRRFDHGLGVLATAPGALQLALLVVVDAHDLHEAIPAAVTFVRVEGHTRRWCKLRSRGSYRVGRRCPRGVCAHALQAITTSREACRPRRPWWSAS